MTRKNAMRKKHKPGQSQSQRTGSKAGCPTQLTRSAPTSPTQVVLHEVNDLSAVLRPRVPLVAQAVRLDGAVQQIDRALQAVEVTPTRRSARIQALTELGKSAPDYHHLHRRGWRY